MVGRLDVGEARWLARTAIFRRICLVTLDFCAIVFDVDSMIRDGVRILLTANGKALVVQMVNPYLYVNHVVRFDASCPEANGASTRRGSHIWLYRR